MTNYHHIRAHKLLIRFLSAVFVAGCILILAACRPSSVSEPSASDTRAPFLPPNPYGPNDFQFVDGYLTCLTADSRLGIDVSSHQEAVDWHRVAQAGIEFAVIRVGYRGYGSGKLVIDDYAEANLSGAEEAGLEVGVYFYSQAITPEEAREEAGFVLDFLSGRHLDLPVVYDWEYVTADARTGQMNRRTLTDSALAFCQAVEDGGYEAMIYFNLHLSENLYHLEELAAYPFWLALYQPRMAYPHRVQMWQYTDAGKVPGIEGNVDLNLWLP